MPLSAPNEYRRCIEQKLSICKINGSIFVEYGLVANAFPARSDLVLARPPPYANVREVKLWANEIGFEVIWKAPIAECYKASPFEFKKIY